MNDDDDALFELQAAAFADVPSDAELAAAPLIQNWSLQRVPGIDKCIYALAGVVSGHPRLPDGPATTSAVRAVSIDESWARTRNRIYRLGERQVVSRPRPHDPLVAEVRKIVAAIAAENTDEQLRDWARHGVIRVVRQPTGDYAFTSPASPSGRLPAAGEHAWSLDRSVLIELALRMATARAKRWRADQQRLLPMPTNWLDVLRGATGDRFRCEVSINSGWLDLMLAVDEWIWEIGPPAKWGQIKQKFGEMRMYPDSGLDELALDVIEHSESILSEHVCEECGAPAESRMRGGYVYTSCDEHLLS